MIEYNLDAKMRNIFFEYFNIKINDKNSSNKLLGEELNLMPRDLVSLVFIIKKVFDIDIPQKIFFDNKFDTYIHILDICEKLYYTKEGREDYEEIG